MNKKYTSEELLNKMASASEHIDWGESINEPYRFKNDNVELIKDISIELPLQTKYGIKSTLGATTDSDQVKMVINFEHESHGDSLVNVREDYVNLIKEMRIAKHRNELICQEILNKHDKYNK